MLHVLLAGLLHADVLVSAGHEGRPASCAHFPRRACNLGTAGERGWTSVVADEATRDLRAMGLRVARLPADFSGRYVTKAALFIHFDGAVPPCTSGASIGYHTAASKRAADLWRQTYSAIFPFRFMPDNFTRGLRDYYAFRQVAARDGALVVEMGEMTCPAQHAWLQTRLRLQGRTLAQFVRRLLQTGT